MIVWVAAAVGGGDGDARRSFGRSHAVVRYAERALAQSRNATGDLRRARQHLRAIELARKTTPFDAPRLLQHALRARELGRRVILANGWKLKRAFLRDTDAERRAAGPIDVGVLDRAVDDVVVREELPVGQ